MKITRIIPFASAKGHSQLKDDVRTAKSSGNSEILVASNSLTNPTESKGDLQPAASFTLTKPSEQVEVTSEIDLSKLTSNFTGTINQFLDLPPDTPLTIQNLGEVQDKFWPSASGTQAIFCSRIWQSCEGVARILSQNTLSREGSNNVSSKLKFNKKPVVCSTREGLDITFDLKASGNGLEINSACVNPGGSSINVARALNNFGTPFELVGIRGYGVRSDIFSKLLEKEGIDPSSLLEVNSDIRFHFCTFALGKEYWIVSLSPCLTPNEVDRFTSQLLSACQDNKGQVVTMANNPPLGTHAKYMPEIIREAQEKSHMFVVYDTKLMAVGKDLLKAILESGPSMIKPNLAEYSEIVDVEEKKLREDRDLIIHLGKGLIEKYGIKMILVSLDKDGALLIDKKRAAFAEAPKIVVASTVGAGDTGIAAMIAKGKQEKHSFKKPSDKAFQDFLGAFIAGGSATASKPGTELATLEDLQRMEREVRVKLI